MSVSSDTADQSVKMTLEAIESAAKMSASIGGMTAKSLAAMIYAIITDNKKTHGKTRLNAMLKSGKELKVIAISHKDLNQFCKAAKQYGVLYCVLKEKNNTNGIVDIMIRSEDAAKVSRIVDKYDLASINTKVIREAVLSNENDKVSMKDVDLNVKQEVVAAPSLARAKDKVSEECLKKSNLKKKLLEPNKVVDDMNPCCSKESVKTKLQNIQKKQENLKSVRKMKRRVKEKER